MTEKNAKSPALAAVAASAEALSAARVALNVAVMERDAAISVAIDADDAVIDVAYAARMTPQNVVKRVAVAAADKAVQL